MFKTGSKFLFALAAFGFVAAIAYAGATGDHKLGIDSIVGPLTFGYKGYVGEHLGYAVLMGLAGAALFGGIFLTALRDADPEDAAAALGLDTVPEVPTPSSVNYWPVIAAFSVGAVALGLAVGPTMFVIGVVGLAAATVEWSVRAWSDRATGDPEVNAAIRHRLMNPVEIPAAAVIGIGGVVLCVSRVLLALPKGGSYAVFGIVPAVILGIGVLIALRPKLSSSVIAGLLLVLGLAVLAGGVAAGIHGERKHEEHHEEEEEGAAAPMPAPALTVIRVGA